MKIGVMGAHGSFSEQAGELYKVNKGLIDADVSPLISAETVLTELEAGNIEYGIFPIENSTGGIVIEAVYAMAGHRFLLQEMFGLDIHHMLLVKRGMTTAHITRITSHDQALKQCKGYLSRVWPEAEVIEFKDTAAAAAALQAGELPDTTAVIAPRQCAKLYDLDILEESIQDSKNNVTTFVVATKIAD